MSFTYNLSSGTANLVVVSKIRLEIGDKRIDPDGALPEGRNLSDEEILYFYDNAGSDYWETVARCYDALASEWAVYPTETRTGPLSEKMAAHEYFRMMALRARSNNGRPTSIAVTKSEYALDV